MNGRLDMDGVISNCALAVSQKLGADYPLDVVENAFCYRYEGQYGFDAVRVHFEEEKFWSEMPKYSWSDRIIDLFERHFGDDWVFSTKGFHHKASLSGKYEWIEKHYPQHLDKLTICIGRIKHTACDGPHSFLLDDDERNINLWRQKGGAAFHWVEMTEVSNNEIIDQRIEQLEEFLQDRAKAYKAYA